MATAAAQHDVSSISFKYRRLRPGRRAPYGACKKLHSSSYWRTCWFSHVSKHCSFGCDFARAFDDKSPWPCSVPDITWLLKSRTCDCYWRRDPRGHADGRLHASTAWKSRSRHRVIIYLSRSCVTSVCMRSSRFKMPIRWDEINKSTVVTIFSNLKLKFFFKRLHIFRVKILKLIIDETCVGRKIDHRQRYTDVSL